MTTHYCPRCEEERSFHSVRRTQEYCVRGMKLNLDMDVEVCDVCGETLYDEQREQGIVVSAFDQYRRHKGLLSPGEIKAIRDRYALSQRSFAHLLGMSEATINRYEGGALQEETHDTMIRLASKPEAILELVERRGSELSAKQRERVIAAAQFQICEIPLHRKICLDYSHDLTGGRTFSFDRYAATVAWFCHTLDGVLKTKMNKLLFYADFLDFKEFGTSITGTPYRCLQHGPVPIDYGTLQDGMEEEDIIFVEEGSYESSGMEYVIMRAGAGAKDLDIVFSLEESRVLKYVADTFKADGSKAISERSHKETAWMNTPLKSLISFSHAANLSISLPKTGSGPVSIDVVPSLAQREAASSGGESVTREVDR
ncbi:MAG: DUF4065 domain-containing protein [Gammaproteobacteria bacterium]|nr:DUF4065 domain-containing protein [Gammaproteobacteria bacterium]